jgi:hypothetical protein
MTGHRCAVAGVVGLTLGAACPGQDMLWVSEGLRV